MAALIRKTDSALFVSRNDPAADQNGKPAPDPRWLLNEGQPAECTRFRVRPLTAVEITGDVTNADACRMGLVEIDGVPCSVDDISPLWVATIGSLVSAVTYIPLVGPGSALTASPAPAEIDSPDLPK